MFWLDTTHLIYLLMGQIIAFSACLLLMGTRDVTIRIWILSNLCGVIGIYCVSAGSGAGSSLSAIGGSLNIASGLLKALALADNRLHFRRNRILKICIAIGTAAALIIAVYVNTPYRFLLLEIGLIAGGIAALAGISSNRRWLGLRPTGLVMMLVTLITLGSFSQLWRAYPFGSQTVMMENTPIDQLSFLVYCTMTMFLQLVFLALLFAENSRAAQARLRREARLYIAVKIANSGQRNAEAVAEERQNLIKMLTHEVRQPLNTAQAVLQSIGNEISAPNLSATSVKSKLNNTLTVLSAITLSISNSLLGATLISNRRQAKLETVDICEVSQLAYLDVSARDRNRIKLAFAQPCIFTEADPIVLRLALRNLLENAVKYSPADTPIIFEITLDEGSLTLQFSVTNQIIDASMLDGDIFARNKRGADSRYDGDGLGLFIVNEVAAMHAGKLRYDLAGNMVTFKLEIPA